MSRKSAKDLCFRDGVSPLHFAQSQNDELDIHSKSLTAVQQAPPAMVRRVLPFGHRQASRHGSQRRVSVRLDLAHMSGNMKLYSGRALEQLRRMVRTSAVISFEIKSFQITRVLLRWRRGCTFRRPRSDADEIVALGDWITTGDYVEAELRRAHHAWGGSHHLFVGITWASDVRQVHPNFIQDDPQHNVVSGEIFFRCGG